MGRIETWWRRKYQLPTTHALFRGQSVAELLVEQYADLFDEKSILERRLETRADDPHARTIILDRIHELEAALSGGKPPKFNDPLVEQWEADLAAGRVPDLRAKMPRGGTPP